jgi:hypothetical protein
MESGKDLSLIHKLELCSIMAVKVMNRHKRSLIFLSHEIEHADFPVVDNRQPARI